MIPIVLFFQATTSKSWRAKLSGVYRFAQEARWQVQVIDAGHTPVEIREALELWHPCGCIIDRAMTLAKPPSRVFKKIPIVLLDQNPQTDTGKHPTVVHASRETAVVAARELLSTDIQDFTYIPWRKHVFWSEQRESAFSACIRQSNRNFIKWPGSLEKLPKPCGILCANDMVAQRAMAEASRLGYSCPADFLFIGIDNDELICEHTRPGLTSVLPDFERAGYLAASLLKEVMDGHPKQHLQYHPTALVRRESTRWFRKTDPRVSRALEYIQSHVFEPQLKTADVVTEMKCSRRLADLRFREITGRSIRDEIHAIRLEKAFSLLRNPDQAIGPIANLVGYDSEPFFKRMFKKTTGLTMREWRKKNATLQPCPR